jgi:hypothetical protein
VKYTWSTREAVDEIRNQFFSPRKEKSLCRRSVVVLNEISCFADGDAPAPSLVLDREPLSIAA